MMSSPRDIGPLEALLGDGSQFGIRMRYKIQPEPKGISESILIGESFLAGEPFLLMLGDNLLYGGGLGESLATEFKVRGAKIFLQRVKTPENYGVAELSEKGTRIVSIEEKPSRPKSDMAIVGLYHFDETAVERAKRLRPSERGELEITDLIRSYMSESKLDFLLLERGAMWLDAGTIESLAKASEFVQVIENRQGLLVNSPHEVAWRLGLLDGDSVQKIAKKFESSDYGKLLGALIQP